MKSNPTEEDMSGMETGAKGASKAEHAAAGAHSSPKKRRKVNHGKKSICCDVSYQDYHVSGAFARFVVLQTIEITSLT